MIHVVRNDTAIKFERIQKDVFEVSYVNLHNEKVTKHGISVGDTLIISLPQVIVEMEPMKIEAEIKENIERIRSALNDGVPQPLTKLITACEELCKGT